MTSSHPNPAKQPYGTRQVSTERSQDLNCWLRKVGSCLHLAQCSQDASKRVFPRLPETLRDRRNASITELPFDAGRLTPSEISAAEEKGKTVLYLAYGSNLCEETFRGVRGIKPISQINVLVPSLRLTFDLPGIPYTEPCFANTAVRDPESGTISDGHARGTDYHKDRWHKGLVGCVYEVTPSDFAHIIATEGAGSAYHDILVDCYPLPDSDTVPDIPSTGHFKAHTLFAPATDAKTRNLVHITDRFSRPDPGYAQPSPRYLKLITDGAAELSLPAEYQAYLNDIRTYTITTKRQAVGKMLFTGIWLPFITMIFGLNSKLQDKNGRAPKWLATLSAMLFLSMWTSYDVAFKRLFGDGERTDGDDAGDQYVYGQAGQDRDITDEDKFQGHRGRWGSYVRNGMDLV
ncbi:hypothetical protein BU26DRAFT_524322 [Trematosphaeria pertusa]|uniref:gamma-glutamylcyclotransferase n=1 Tax=Trematosphaeria pertusa TaxID=390896 RepID=A0A6A6HXK6_9PLEO|nr:uncharacterized protein BU26DRAFT_524322 [Trematosphaeria pertusa]KAF2242761.1 hypothetical protein BU26DRAFT_524322 [Trematosphaeria pertusa]